MKAPAVKTAGIYSFDFGFLEKHVLAHDRIVFLEFKLVWRGALVLGGRIVVTRSGTGYHFDFFPHGGVSLLDLDATLAHIGKHGVDAFLVDDSHAFAGNAQRDPAIFAFHPELVIVKIGQKAPLGFIVGMGNIVAGEWALARDLTHSGHVRKPLYR